MRPAEVGYQRALDLRDVGQLLQSNIGAQVIAGGQNLLRDLRQRTIQPRMLIDIARLGELSFIRREDAVLEIGAVTTLADVAASDEVRTAAAALAEAARRVGDVQIRSRGTVGGNVCGPWSPAGWSADIGTVLTASGGAVVAHSADGDRTIPAEEFTAAETNPLAATEVIRALRFPLAQGSAYYRLARRWADASIGAVAAFVDLTASGHPNVRLAAGRIHRHTLRLREVEDAVAAHGPESPEVDDAVRQTARSLTAVDGVQADGNYRLAVFPVLIRRAIRQAITNAENATTGGTP